MVAVKPSEHHELSHIEQNSSQTLDGMHRGHLNPALYVPEALQ